MRFLDLTVLFYFIIFKQYFIIVLLLFVVLLIGGILGYVFRGKAESTVMNAMTVTMSEYQPDSGKLKTKAWDETQTAVSNNYVLLKF